MSETQRLEERLVTWAAAPAEGMDWEEVLRRAGERSVVRPFSPRRLAFALAAVVVLVGGSLAAAFLVDRPGPAPTGPLGAGGLGGARVRIPDGSNLWGQYGRQISIDDLRAEAPYVPLPNSPLANDDNVGTVWVWDHTSDPQTPVGHVAVVVYYPGSGIELLWTRGSPEYGGFPSRMIDGVRASLLPGNWHAAGPTGAAGTTPGPQELSTLRLPVGSDETLTLDGVVPESELIDVAETLTPSPGEVASTP
jgi:hypothetical protein